MAMRTDEGKIVKETCYAEPSPLFRSLPGSSMGLGVDLRYLADTVSGSGSLRYSLVLLSFTETAPTLFETESDPMSRGFLASPGVDAIAAGASSRPPYQERITGPSVSAKVSAQSKPRER